MQIEKPKKKRQKNQKKKPIDIKRQVQVNCVDILYSSCK